MVDKSTVQDIATGSRQYAIDAINNATLQDIAEIMESLLNVTVAAIPEIFRHYEFTIGMDALGRSRMIDKNIVPTMPWIAVTIVNDGAVPVYVDINEKRDMQEHLLKDGFKPDWFGSIKPHESQRFNMKYSGIERVFFTCEPGKQTVVRLYSESKRYKKGPDLVDVIEGTIVQTVKPGE